MPAISSRGRSQLSLFLVAAAGVTGASAQPFAYVSNQSGNTVSVVNLANDKLTTSIFYSAGGLAGLAITPNGSYLYVAAQSKNSVVVMSTLTNTVAGTVGVGTAPTQVAVTPNGATVYVANGGSNNVSAVDTASNSVSATIPVGTKPAGLAIAPDGSTAYVVNFNSSNVSVINTASNTVVQTWNALSGPTAVAVSPNSNVIYVANQYSNAVTVHDRTSGTILATITGFTAPNAMAVTPNGRYLYVVNANASTVSVVDTVSNQILSPSINVGSLPSSLAISADGSTVYVTNSNSYTLSIISTATNTVTNTIARVGIYPVGVVLSPVPVTNITKSGGDGQSALVGTNFPVPLQVTITDGNGSPIQGAAVTFSVIPGASGAGGFFATAPPMPVITSQYGVAVAPVLTANATPGPFTVSATANAVSTTFTLSNVSPVYALGTNTATVGSGAGNGSVLLAANGPWTAVSNAYWLHIAPGSSSGTGNASIQYSCDANLSTVAQTASLTIAGLAFTVSQAGTNYMPVAPVTTLVDSGLNLPRGVALDGHGNVYIADTGNNVIKQWNAASQQVAALPCAGLSTPSALAVDPNDNVYIADTGNNAIKECNPVTQQMTSLVSSGVNMPSGVALDAQGNVYISDSGNSALKKWNAANQQVITLAAQGMNHPYGIAVDVQENLYIADRDNHTVDEWNASSQQLQPLVSSGLSAPSGVAVDGEGNVYIVDAGYNYLDMWNSTSQQMSVLLAGLSSPAGTAVDPQGNVYIADTSNNAVRKITEAYLALSPLTFNESAAAGADSLTALVLPANTPLSVTSDAAWLAISSVSGGSIPFTFGANTSALSRTATITVLGVPVSVTQSPDAPAALTVTGGQGQSAAVGQVFPISLQVTVMDSGGIPLQGVPVTFNVTPGASGAAGTFASSPPMPITTDQNGAAVAPLLTANNTGGVFTVIAAAGGLNVTFTLTNIVNTLGATSTIVGSAAGTDGVFLAAAGSWNAISNAPWLHPAIAGGTGNAVIEFGYDANSSSTTRTGSLTIGNLTFTVTQAGASFAAVTSLQALSSSGLKTPQGVAVDSHGNVYIADTGNNALKEWNATSQQTTTLISSGLNAPSGVAVDTFGNVYIADTRNNAVKVWSATTQQLTTLLSGLSGPFAVATDSLGNVYVSDTGNNAIRQWSAATQQVTTLVSSGLNGPRGLAVDTLGNVYFADSKNNSVKEWNPSTQTVSTLVSSGLNNPSGVAVDGEGNVYVTDTANNAIKQSSPFTGQTVTLTSTALKTPVGLAIDGLGNLFVANSAAGVIDEVVPGFLGFSVAILTEGAQAGNGAVTLQVLPVYTPWTAASDQSWLKIVSTSGGVVSFSFTANASASSRVAHIKVLGLQVTVTQSGDTAAGISKTAGMNQVASVGQLFLTNLQVSVKDAAGKPVSGVPVTFTVIPGHTGATASFASLPPMPILTNGNGYATAPALTAGAIAGTFTVSANAGSLSTIFTLKISAP